MSVLMLLSIHTYRYAYKCKFKCRKKWLKRLNPDYKDIEFNYASIDAFCPQQEMDERRRRRRSCCYAVARFRKKTQMQTCYKISYIVHF